MSSPIWYFVFIFASVRGCLSLFPAVRDVIHRFTNLTLQVILAQIPTHWAMLSPTSTSASSLNFPLNTFSEKELVLGELVLLESC